MSKCLIQNSLIDLGVAINVMSRDTMLMLNVRELLRHASTILQLENRSTINLEEMLGKVIISIYSWEYPKDL